MPAEIVRGADADLLLTDAGFLGAWRRLASACPWATAFQTPRFAAAWYGAYRESWEPVLVLDRGPDGLTGLLALAAGPGGALAAVGANQAEYHAWLAPEGQGDAFAAAAFAAVRRASPGRALHFRYLPPGAPTAWLAAPEFRRSTRLTPRRRPLLEFGDGAETAASLAKESNRSRLRRLARLGPVSLRVVTDPDEFADVLPTVIRLYDTRRLAVNGVAPFRRDPCKRPFHEAMAREPGLIHVSLLMAGDRVAAAHLGALSGPELQLGLIAHDPLLAKHSPGKFLVLLLAQALREQGLTRFDLTAGGEPYKERFANAWDEVHTLGVYPGPAARAKAGWQESFADGLKARLIRAGVSPARARFLATEARRLGPLGAARAASAWVGGRSQTHLDVQTWTRRPATERPANVARDDLDALLAALPADTWPSPQAFASEATERLEAGQHLYTVVENGRLLARGWLAETPGEALLTRTLPGLAFPAGHALALDVVTAPEARGRGLATAVLRAMQHDAAGVKGVKGLAVAVPADSPAARRVAEKLGLTRAGTVAESTRFGRVTRTAEPPAPVNPPAPAPAPSRGRAATPEELNA